MTSLFYKTIDGTKDVVITAPVAGVDPVVVIDPVILIPVC